MKEGLDKGYDKRAHHVGKLEDSAEIKAVILNVSKKIIDDLTPMHELTDENSKALKAGLEDALIRSMLNHPSDIRGLAVETLRDVMRKKGIEAPGFRDDYLEELEARMKVRISH